MKKLVLMFGSVCLLVLLSAQATEAKPFYIKFKLGLFAKWSVTFNGECEDGWGLCIAVGDSKSPIPESNYLGYDNETDKFTLKISKKWGAAKYFSSGSYDVKEDSPVDPRLIEQFTNFKGKMKTVIIRKGVYKVADDGEYYLMTVSYYLQ